MSCFFFRVEGEVCVWVCEVLFGDVGACSVSVVLCFVVFEVFGGADDAGYFPGVGWVEGVVFVALEVDEDGGVDLLDFLECVDDEVDVFGVALVGVGFDECGVVGELEVVAGVAVGVDVPVDGAAEDGLCGDFAEFAE